MLLLVTGPYLVHAHPTRRFGVPPSQKSQPRTGHTAAKTPREPDPNLRADGQPPRDRRWARTYRLYDYETIQRISDWYTGHLRSVRTSVFATSTIGPPYCENATPREPRFPVSFPDGGRGSSPVSQHMSCSQQAVGTPRHRGGCFPLFHGPVSHDRVDSSTHLVSQQSTPVLVSQHLLLNAKKCLNVKPTCNLER